MTAKEYVGTDEISGALQLSLLQREGCLPNSYVLEVGCGTLHAGLHLIKYLDDSHYVGIDPNKWLIDYALDQQDTRQIVINKFAQFLFVSDFDASKLNIKFDFILSHSVLSHTAHWQLEQFLQNTAKVLTSKGKIIASIRLAEEDSKDTEWQYAGEEGPGVSFFNLDTVIEVASSVGLNVEVKPEYTKFYTATRPAEIHDWLIFKPKV